MRPGQISFSVAVILAAHLQGCGDGSSAQTGSGTTTSEGGAAGTTSTAGAGGGGATGGTGTGGSGATGGGGSGSALTCDKVKGAAEAYKAAHPGNGGKDWDVLTKTPAEVAKDPEAQALLALCGTDERPVIPLLAWEYGGNDHPSINPGASALFYCVHIPVNPSTEHWQYDAATDHVTADVSIGCPEQNPCKDQQGADLVMACLGSSTNIEMMVDIASLDDGAAAGLSLSEASTDLFLVEPDGTKVHLYTGL